MILITGGAYQGKTDYAIKKFGFSENEIADGADNTDTLLKVKCITHFEKFVFRIYESGGDMISETDRILSHNPNVIILMTEIGSGIIPLEKDERKKREYAGKIGCLLAEKADTVIRMTCGIPTVIKGKMP